MNVFQQLYDSEINFRVSCFWDGGFDVRLGDELNGFVAEARLDTWAEVEPWLKERAQQHFPDSHFTRVTLVPQWEEAVAKKAKKTARGRALDRRLVSGQQKYEADYVARYSRTSRDAVKKAVKKVGKSRKKVREALSH